MSISRLEDLPADILRQIHDYLDDEDPPSLLSLAFASKRCYISAAYRLHRELRLSFAGFKDPTDSVRDFTRRIETAFLLGYVRRLRIVCDQPCGIQFIYRSDRAFNDVFGICTYSHIDDLDHNVNFSWKPVAEILEKLKNLREFVFEVPEQLPRCLLETLHQSLPRCKLYIDNFRLKAFHTGRIRGYERKLATSPCLYSIRIPYSVLPICAKSIAKLVTNFSPNLRFVVMTDVGQDTKWSLFGEMRPGNGCTRGSLESLTLQMHHWGYHRKHTKVTRSAIQGWGAITDFTVLKTLDLSHPPDIEAVTLLASCSLPGLKNLALSFGTARPTRQWINKFQQFFTSLPSLSTLRLSEWSGVFPLNTTLNRHTELHRLAISPTPGAYLTTADVHYLSVTLLSLVDLSVPIQRTGGNATEASGYRKLGTLPNLRHLKLELCTLPRVLLKDAWYGGTYLRVDRSWTRFQRERFDGEGHVQFGPGLRKGHIMDILTNSAVDEALACSIFQAVSSGKPRDAAPLERLHLEVNSLWKVRALILHKILSTLSPPWHIERGLRDGGWTVQREEAYSHVHKMSTFYGNAESSEQFSTIYKPILCYIWPSVESSAVWWDECKSIPLSQS